MIRRPGGWLLLLLLPVTVADGPPPSLQELRAALDQARAAGDRSARIEARRRLGIYFDQAGDYRAAHAPPGDEARSWRARLPRSGDDGDGACSPSAPVPKHTLKAGTSPKRGIRLAFRRPDGGALSGGGASGWTVLTACASEL